VTRPFPDHPPVIAQIGDMAVTSSTIATPAGQFALPGSQWTIADQWTVRRKTPQWAVLAALVGFCVLTFFSLLFLLVKEQVYTGTVTVTVINGGFAHTARIPVTNADQVANIYSTVNYIRSLAAI
jgi:hypothetical protein